MKKEYVMIGIAALVAAMAIGCSERSSNESSSAAPLSAKSTRITAKNERFLSAGTSIQFKGASDTDPGIITVIEGVLEVTYFDGSKGTVGIGKYPVLSGTVVKDSWVYIDESAPAASLVGGTGGEPPVLRSGSTHVKWYEWSKWN